MKEIYQKRDFLTTLLNRKAHFFCLNTTCHPPVLTGFSILLFFVLYFPQGFASPLAFGKAAMFADTILVKGIVSDKAGTLPGVSVASKSDRRISTMTDANGAFKIKVPSSGTLVFSSIGYRTQEEAVDKRSEINLILSEEVKSLEEVVVIGYGTQTREKLIGSVAQISGEQIAERPVTQLREALTGQMPGVTVTQRTGRPGKPDGAISVRGVGSFGATPSALFLVDGIAVDNYNDIDPNDVEAISVLKDASSAAIYGSRAANGVVLITTKSGVAGKPKVSYNAYAGIQNPTAYPDFVNSWEYQQAYYEAQNGSTTLTQQQIEEVEKYRAQNDPNYPNNNFLNHVLSKEALQTGHNITISGGSNTNKFNLSLGYLNQEGLVVRNNYNRYNVRLNMNTALGSKFNLTTRIAAITSKVNEPMAPAGVPGFGGDMLGVIGQAARTNGSFVAIDQNGDFSIGAGGGTPVSYLATNSFNRQRNLNLNGNLRLDYQVYHDLKLSLLTSYVQDNGRETEFRSNQRLASNIILGPNFLSEYTNTNHNYTLQGLAEYTKQVGKHQVSLLGGYSFEDFERENFNAFRDNFPGNDLTVLNVGSPLNQQSNGTGSENSLESQFARVNYSYANKYLVEGVIRRDGSSRFPTGNKYAVFPSVAAGWRIGQEQFIRDMAPWISELKVKASWGVLGNQNIGNYQYQNTLVSSTANSSGTNYSFGGQIAQGVARTTLVDSTLRWESTRTKDIGLEVGILKKLNLSASYFDRYTYDILYSPAASVSGVLGMGISQRNTGSLKNTGWEFTLGHNSSIGKFSYSVNGHFSIINNKVLDLGVGNVSQPNGLIGNGSSLFIGQPMQLYYGYVADGLFVDQADIDSWANMKAVNPSAKPGDIRYKDISGPGGVPDGVVNATYDRAVLGSQIPKYTFGANLGGSYGGFDLNILLQGISGVTGRLQSYAGWALFNTTGNVQRWQYEGRWTDKNPDRNAIYPRFENVPNAGTNNTILSSFWTLNGAYMRIKNVQLGYKLPSSVTEKVKIANARFYLSGENLHTFSNYRKGWDPEIDGDANFYPIMAVYTLGLNVTF